MLKSRASDEDLGVPEVDVGLVPGGVGPDQRGDGRDEQHEAARGFDAHEGLRGLEDAVIDEVSSG